MSAPKSLTIFFPAYNEAATIEKTLEETVRVLETRLGILDYELLVVDDGSTDATAALVDAAALKNPRIRRISHPVNLGYGAALCTGYTSASKEVIFYTDADLPIDFADIERAWQRIAEYDAVIGYRIKRHDRPRRFVYSKIYNFLIRRLRGVKVRDVNFSFKMIRKSALHGAILRSRTVYVDGELLGIIFDRKLRVLELPIDYTPRAVGSSSFDHPLYALATFFELFSDLCLRRVFSSRNRAINIEPSVVPQEGKPPSR